MGCNAFGVKKLYPVRAPDFAGSVRRPGALAAIPRVAGDAVAGQRVKVDPDAFAWPAGGTEKFLGRDTALSPSSAPRPRRAWPDPVNLFGAATACGRTKSNLSGAPRVRKAKRILEPQKKREKASAQKERTIDFRGH
jgi:hypothetical protein